MLCRNAASTLAAVVVGVVVIAVAGAFAILPPVHVTKINMRIKLTKSTQGTCLFIRPTSSWGRNRIRMWHENVNWNVFFIWGRSVESEGEW